MSDFAYYVFGQELAVAMYLWYVVLACHQYDVCENYVGSVYVGGYGGLKSTFKISYIIINKCCIFLNLLMLVFESHESVVVD